MVSPPDAPRIGHEYEPGAVNLNLFKRGRIGASPGQQPNIDVFPDGQTQRVTGLNGVRANQAGVNELRRKPECGHNRGGPRDPVVHLDDERIALLLHGSGKYFALGGA